MTELSVDDLLAMPPEAIEAALPDQHPVACYLYAQRLLQQGEIDAAVFWGYVGQLRYRFWIQTLAAGEQAAAVTSFSVLQEGIGLSINRAIGTAPERWWQILGDVLAWDSQTRNGFTCTQQHALAWMQTRAGLESFRADLKQNADAISGRFLSATTGVHGIDLATVEAQAWRNGGGTTRELLRWPRHSTADTWQLRVSVADIDRSGPFSEYPGIDRWFTVLEGAGVTLHLPDATHAVGPDDAPVSFPGEAQPLCDLLDGGTRNLNLMLRRGAGSIHVDRIDHGELFDGCTRWRALYCLAAGRLDVDGTTLPVHAGLLLWSQRPDRSRWRWLDQTPAVFMCLSA